MRNRFVALSLVAAAFLGACGSSGAEEAKGRKLKQLPGNLLPADLLGLEVRRESITANVKEQTQSYLDSVGLYSMRKGDLLQATLQVSRFAKGVDHRKRDFRQAIITQIGTTVPKSVRMGKHTVYLTTGKQQNVVIWFKENYTFVLTTREEYEQPRGLLREILEIDFT